MTQKFYFIEVLSGKLWRKCWNGGWNWRCFPTVLVAWCSSVLPGGVVGCCPDVSAHHHHVHHHPHRCVEEGKKPLSRQCKRSLRLEKQATGVSGRHVRVGCVLSEAALWDQMEGDRVGEPGRPRVHLRGPHPPALWPGLGNATRQPGSGWDMRGQMTLWMFAVAQTCYTMVLLKLNRGEAVSLLLKIGSLKIMKHTSIHESVGLEWTVFKCNCTVTVLDCI